MKNYRLLRKKIIQKLQSELSEDLLYHNFDHIIDVLNICNRYIKREKIPPYDAKLLRLGALFHDIGFTSTRFQHENKGVEIAMKMMNDLNFQQQDCKVIKGLILATRIPQKPKNYFEKIICDADLDYLGRDDYYEISNNLFKEINTYSKVDKKDWHNAQIKFLKEHTYHTKFAIKNRRPLKQKRIAELTKMNM